MNRKFNPLLAVGAVLLIVGIAVLGVLASRGSDNKVTSLKVLVASRDVLPNTAANAAGLSVQDVKSSDVPPGAVTSLAAVNGQIALRQIAKGTVITTDAFGQLGAATDTGVTLPTGKEAVGIELAFAPGAIRYVIPNNHVTVWMTPKPVGGETVSATAILNDILVLRTTPGVGNGQGTAPVPGPGNLDFLLAVSRTEAARLFSAQASGASLFVTLSKTSTS